MAGRTAPESGSPTYRQVWRVVDGAVREALRAHPDFVAKGKRISTVRNSITKRVVGAICGYADQSAWVRSGSSPADDMAVARLGADAEKARAHAFSGEAIQGLPALSSP